MTFFSHPKPPKTFSSWSSFLPTSIFTSLHSSYSPLSLKLTLNLLPFLNLSISIPQPFSIKPSYLLAQPSHLPIFHLPTLSTHPTTHLYYSRSSHHSQTTSTPLTKHRPQSPSQTPNPKPTKSQTQIFLLSPTPSHIACHNPHTSHSPPLLVWRAL